MVAEGELGVKADWTSSLAPISVVERFLIYREIDESLLMITKLVDRAPHPSKFKNHQSEIINQFSRLFVTRQIRVAPLISRNLAIFDQYCPSCRSDGAPKKRSPTASSINAGRRSQKETKE